MTKDETPNLIFMSHIGIQWGIGLVSVSAITYLYHKETRSSFEIERERQSASRAERFVTLLILLTLASRPDLCDKATLLSLQNQIVDPRFADNDYRASQNYVGELLSSN